jgi:hypothetical protein
MPDQEVYSTKDVAECVGLSLRQADHLARTAGIRLRHVREHGSGRHRIWTTQEMWIAAVLAALLHQNVPIAYLPGVWQRLSDAHLKPGDDRWLSVACATGVVRVHKTPRGAGVWWVSLAGAVDPAEQRRRALHGVQRAERAR